MTDPTDVKSRRERLGLEIDEMAVGIDMPAATLRLVEAANPPPAGLVTYEKWLARIERWSEDRRKSCFARARDGMRFL